VPSGATREIVLEDSLEDLESIAAQDAVHGDRPLHVLDNHDVLCATAHVG